MYLKSRVDNYASIVIACNRYSTHMDLSGIVANAWHAFWSAISDLGRIVVIAVLFERRRYRRIEHSKGGQWQPTGECFQDPETGQTVEVLYDPVSGERRYVQGHDHLPPKK